MSPPPPGPPAPRACSSHDNHESYGGLMASETWTVQRVLDWTVGYLERKGDERPRL